MAVPLKSGLGVKVTVPLRLITTVPSGELAATTVSGSPSTSLSLASSAMVTGVSSFVVAASSTATGGSFTAATLIVSVTVAKPPFPSLIV